MANKLVDSMVNIREHEALLIVQEAIARGENAYSLMDSCQEAMKIVGQKFEKQEYFLPELIACGALLKKISDILKPKMMEGAREAGGARRGKIVLGTVHGDIHDIGKDIVGFMLDLNGFEIIDLGVDVPKEKFVKAVSEVRPQVVALSAVLTLAYDAMKSTVESLEQAGLRNTVKVMIGGGQTNEMVKDYVKADGYGTDVMAAVRMANEWIP